MEHTYCISNFFCGCYNKSPRTKWLKTTDTYSLIVPEARNPKSVSLGRNRGVCRATLSPEALGKNPLLVSSGFWWLSASASHRSLSSSSHNILFCIFNFSLPCSYKDKCDCTGTRLDNTRRTHRKILGLITLAKIPFPNKVTFTGSGDSNLVSLGDIM